MKSSKNQFGIFLAVLCLGTIGSALGESDLPEGLRVENLPEVWSETPPWELIIKGKLELEEGFGTCWLKDRKKPSEGLRLIWRPHREDYIGLGQCQLDVEPDIEDFFHVSVIPRAYPEPYSEGGERRVRLMLDLSGIQAVTRSPSDAIFPNNLGPHSPMEILDVPIEVPNETGVSDSTIVEP